MSTVSTVFSSLTTAFVKSVVGFFLSSGLCLILPFSSWISCASFFGRLSLTLLCSAGTLLWLTSFLLLSLIVGRMPAPPVAPVETPVPVLIYTSASLPMGTSRSYMTGYSVGLPTFFLRMCPMPASLISCSPSTVHYATG